MRRLLAIIFLAMPLTLRAGDWTPPEKPNPSEILQQAQDDARKGDYKTALEKHVWYHENALKHDEGQTGVRLSFALMYWQQLGEKYPPALKRLHEIRDQAGEAAKNKQEKLETRQQAFRDFAAINGDFGDQPKTAELFLAIDKQDPKLAADLYHDAQQSLLAAKEYEVCGRYVDPDMEFSHLSELYKVTSAMGKGQNNAGLVVLSNNTLKTSASTLVALLTVVDKKEKAAEIAKAAKKLRDDKDYHAAIDEALEGKFPKPQARPPRTRHPM